jgi:hypothetical protein
VSSAFVPGGGVNADRASSVGGAPLLPSAAAAAGNALGYELAAAGVFALWQLDEHGPTCVLVGRPEVRVVDGRLDCRDAPAVLWASNGVGYWFWDGVWIPERLAAHPDRITGKDVLAERNLERRRLLLETIGHQRFLAEAGGAVVQQGDFGRLWRLDTAVDGEPYAAVEVVNATAEPDGSYRRYFLRVPPTVYTARAAVAWTFGYDDSLSYRPTIET